MEYYHCRVCNYRWTDSTWLSVDVECPECKEQVIDGMIDNLSESEYKDLIIYDPLA